MIADLLAFAGETLARFKPPKQIEFRSSLPYLHSRKLLRRQLRDQVWPGAST